MEKKIIKRGLCCKVETKLALMRSFLTNEENYRTVIGIVKAKGLGRELVPEEQQDQIMKEFGIRIGSVNRLDDEVLRATYDALEQEGGIKSWLDKQTPNMKERAGKVLAWDQEELTIDVTGFLVYAIVENDRCRQRLLEYMEERGEACCQAYRRSAYCDSPLIRWFSPQRRLAAMLCIGLLEQIRQEDKTAYEMFISAASSGYKRMRKYVKHRDGIGGKEFQEIMAEVDADKLTDGQYSLSVGILGLVMAEDLQVPIQMDFLMYSFLPVIQKGAEWFLKAPDPVEVSQMVQERCRAIMKEYCCDEKSWLTNRMYKDIPEYEIRDISGMCAIFGLNIRILRDTVLTEEEIRQLFSLIPELKDAAVMPVLLAAMLCKYIGQMEAEFRPEAELGKLGKEPGADERKRAEPDKLAELRQRAEDLHREQVRLLREREKLAERADQLEQAVSRKREQIRQMKERQEHAGREIKELRNFLYYLTEQPHEADQEEHEADRDGDRDADHRDGKYEDRSCLRKMDLEQRRVVVIGGHENWQRRFREQFPMWQFLSADKNNFDARCVRNKEIIIVNTAVLKHSCYYRIMAERCEGQMVLYVHGNNLQRCLDELARQLEAG